MDLRSSFGFSFTVFQPNLVWFQLPLNTYCQGAVSSGGQWWGSGAAWGRDLPQHPHPQHPEVTSRARLGMAMGTGYLWGQVKEARVGSAREINRDEYNCSIAQAGPSTRAGAEMWPPSPRMNLPAAPSGHVAAFPVRPQVARWPDIRGGLVHSSQTTRVREDVAEPVHAIGAPNISCWKSPDLQFYLDNKKHKVW